MVNRNNNDSDSVTEPKYNKNISLFAAGVGDRIGQVATEVNVTQFGNV